MLVLRSKALAVGAVIVCVGISCSPSLSDADPDPTPPTAADEFLEDMCSRQVRAFGWIFPLRPSYKGSKPNIEKAADGVRRELDELDELSLRTESLVATYLEGLLDLATLLADEPSHPRDLAGLQKRYSTMTRRVAAVYELAVDADLPFECRLDFDSEAATSFRFLSKGARACRVAAEQILEAPLRRVRAGGDELEQFIELQGDFGRIYLQLSEDLEKANPESLALAGRNAGRELVHVYRRAGKARLASESALHAGDETETRAAADRFDQYNKRAGTLARSLGLVFCEELFRFN